MENDHEFQRTLEAARAGDEWALTALYRGLHANLLRYLSAYEPQDADDIAAAVWLDIAAGLDRFEGDERGFRTWSFAIARRRLAEVRRRGPREASGARVRDGGNPSDLAIRSALERVTALPHEEAEVILLRTAGSLTVEEVGTLVHRPAATVRSIQQRAIRRLMRPESSELVA